MLKKIKYLIMLLIIVMPNIVNAEDITSECTILINENSYSKLTDDNENSYVTINNDINISCNEDIYGIYIIYELSSKDGIISNTQNTNVIGENSFLHEYIDVDGKIGVTNNITISYEEEVKIGEIYILSEGELPDYVEVWNAPYEQADLLLFSTHSDDEQLFFLGLIPTYVAKGAYVQVVYYTNHNDNPSRLHEQLHGLYAVGIRNYPIIGFIPDAWSTTLEGALTNLENAGYTEEDAVSFQVEMIRRFKPSVVVGHDENGEYSHGQHILNTYTLEKALELTNDGTYDSDSYELYGGWDVPKTYLHLYEENQIIMDYDTPLDYFNGLTAYEVSKIGYSKHTSQQWTWFTKWINGSNNEYTSATQIKTYSPLEYGLYRSLVGEDTLKNDMFENLTLLKDIVQDEDTLEEKDEIIVNNEDTKKDDYTSIIGTTLIILAIIIIVSILLKSLVKKNRLKK